VTSRAAIIGVGLTPFGKFEWPELKRLAADAIESALRDAGLERSQVDMAFVASTVNALTTGQVAVVGQVLMTEAGLSGIPVHNVENACAGSSTAVNLSTHAVMAGAANAVLVVGIEKMTAPDRATIFLALNGAADTEWVKSTGTNPAVESVFVKEVYQERLREYAARYGEIDPAALATIAVKNRRHAGLNPLAQYREPLTVAEVLAARTVVEPVTTLMCSPIADGVSAVVVASEQLARRSRYPVWIRASAVSMGSPPPREETTIARLAREAYATAGISSADVSVAEVHDATAFGELLATEELGLCPPGQGAAFAVSGETSLGGVVPVNTSGGLESRGHPLAATGTAQLAELAMQLRGEAGERQVPGARFAVAETAGGFVGGDSAAVAVTVVGQEPGNS
jgi:acetyl-CoA acyltransferase